jgi:hypothetical protein
MGAARPGPYACDRAAFPGARILSPISYLSTGGFRWRDSGRHDSFGPWPETAGRKRTADSPGHDAEAEAAVSHRSGRQGRGGAPASSGPDAGNPARPDGCEGPKRRRPAAPEDPGPKAPRRDTAEAPASARTRTARPMRSRLRPEQPRRKRAGRSGKAAAAAALDRRAEQGTPRQDRPRAGLAEADPTGPPGAFGPRRNPGREAGAELRSHLRTPPGSEDAPPARGQPGEWGLAATPAPIIHFAPPLGPTLRRAALDPQP